MKNLWLIFILLSCTTHGTPGPTVSKVKFETIWNGKDVIWGFDFLPDGKIILTERNGRMRLFDPATKVATEVTGLPKIHDAGQGGLLDVRLHPEFAKNKIIYFTYSEPVKKDSTTALGMATLEGTTLTNFKRLFSASRANGNDHHYGSRIEFDGKGHLFFAVGDRGERDQAQKLDHHQGKMMRLNLDGSIPQDNPFIKTKDAKPEIWSLGHRSPQGLVRHPDTNELWEAEMGPQGGDEVNKIHEGKNYGWPVITYGREYHGPKIGTTVKDGMEQPFTYWVPSISPSAMTFYTGDKFPEWKGDMFLATLSGEHVRRVSIKDDKVAGQEELLKDMGQRWRSVRTGPDGYLWLGTDEGRLGRVVKQ